MVDTSTPGGIANASNDHATDKNGNHIVWDPKNGEWVYPDGQPTFPQVLRPWQSQFEHTWNAHHPNSGGGRQGHGGGSGGSGASTGGGNNHPNGNGGGGNGGGNGGYDGSTGSAEHSGGGTNPMVFAISFFRSKGVPDYIIAGIVQNLMAESSLNPGASNPGEGAIGIAQWEGDRDDAMKSWVTAHGMDPSTLEGQLNYLWHEMNTSESGAWNTVKGATSAYDAGHRWAEFYERCAHYSNGVDQWATRANNAGNFFSGGMTQYPHFPQGSDASGSAGGGSLDGSGGAGQRPTNAQGFENRLGEVGNLLTSVPELNTLLQTAIRDGWSVGRLRQAVENSDWYKNNSATARSVLAQQMSDPATYQSNLNKVVGTITAQANSMGFTLDNGTIEAIGKAALLSGNDQNLNWLDQAIGNHDNFKGVDDQTDLKGGMAQTANQLQALAASYGITVDPQRLTHQAKQVVVGDTTIDTFKNQYIAAAKSRFPGISTQLDQGLTVADVAQPYMNSMSSLLEINPNSLSVNTPKIVQALQGQAGQSDGKSSVPTVEPIWQFENRVRKDPRWGFTRNAHDTMSNVLGELGQDWGFAS